MENKLAELRKMQGITQTRLAEKAGVSRPYLSAIEKGKQTVISNVVMIKIATALEQPVGAIFFTNSVV